MGNKRQNTAKEKSLPKETLKESINGEWHGAVAGNASAKNLNGNGSERLNRFALTHSNSTAKLQQNTETTKKKVQNLINNEYAIKSARWQGFCGFFWYRRRNRIQFLQEKQVIVSPLIYTSLLRSEHQYPKCIFCK